MVVYPQASGKGVKDFREVGTTPYVKDYSEERKKALLELLKEEGEVKIMKFHVSLCPGCVDEKKFNKMLIDSVVYERGGKVWILKRCPEHGVFKEIYWEDAGMYKRAEKYQDTGIGIENPHMKLKPEQLGKCPLTCGLCADHETHTDLGNIVLTNRCDLSCWYCFFFAKEGEPIYEPNMEQIRLMLKSMRDTKPIGANSVQFTGGEPTIREDLVDIIKMAREIGYKHIQLNTDGVNLSKSQEFCNRIREAGVSNLYLSFDGMTPKTNIKNYWEAPKAIENCKNAGIGVVLVPTVIGGVNDHELGDIIRFAAGNIDAVRAVNFQPVSLVGRMPDKERFTQRITIPGAIKRIEEQTNGEIGKEHWYPVPCTKSISDFVEAFKDKPKYRLSVHFSCGMGTYVFKDGERLVPLPSFFDAEGFFEYIGQLAEELKGSRVKKLKKGVVASKALLNVRKFIDNEKKPKELNFLKLLTGVVKGGNFKGLAEFHHKSLFIGMMHFQDPYNWDLDRVHKCGIHYAVPDGRVIPFCTFNVIPELYRDAIQRRFSIPAKEWEKLTGKSLKDDKHVRHITKEQTQELAEKYYDKYRKGTAKPHGDWGEEFSREWQERAKRLNTLSEKASRAISDNPGCRGCHQI